MRSSAPEKSKTEKRVGIWIRVSTEDQVRGESPEVHEKRARMYAEARGWKVREVYRLEAVSGKAVMEHPEAQRMLVDIRSHHITGLVFSKLARLARNTKELLDFADAFRDADADMISLHEAIDTGSPAGRLFFTIVAAMAQWEREEIAERVAASVPIRAKMGKPIGGAAPFGYQWKDKKLEPDPKEVPIRALMYELFAEHKRKKTVARLLNERGYRTRNGSKFSDTTVDRLLRDTTAKGIYRQNYTRTNDRTKSWELKPESEWVQTPVEPIVADDLWGRCNLILDEQRHGRRKPTRTNVHLFTGFAHCTCGAKMYVWAETPKYVCPKCRNKIPIADLEAVYRDQLSQFLLSPADIAAHIHAANDMIREKEQLVLSAEAEIKKLETETERLYQLYLADGLSKEDFGRRNRPLAERRAQLEDELPRLQAQLDVMRISTISGAAAIEEVGDLATRWGDFSSEEKRRLVETITDTIVIGKEEVAVNLLYFPSALETGGKATRPHGFIAATSWKRAGKRKCALARATTASPVSMGWRKESRTGRWNSGSSSRNSTPRCASETSPGRTRKPPPISAAIEAEWCGLRNGRRREIAPSRNSPARLWTIEISNASRASSGGKSPGSLAANIDLPEPGGPIISILWPPAAAISSARLAVSWPFTSFMSGMMPRSSAILADGGFSTCAPFT
jgi:site-specific DNA recombinase